MARDLGYIVLSAGDYDESEANAAATVSYAASPNAIHAIAQINASYSAAPTGGKVQIEVNDVVVYEALLSAAGPYQLDFPTPVGALQNQKVDVVLAAGGAAIVGALSVVHKVIRP